MNHSELPGLRDGSFGGLGKNPATAAVVLVPAPWDVTTSSVDGTRNGPEAILEASPQLEFRDPVTGLEWTDIAMLPIDTEMLDTGRRLRVAAREVIGWLEAGAPEPAAATMTRNQYAINRGCAAMNDKTSALCARLIANRQIPGIIGGDHSTPLGMYRALTSAKGPRAILHMDAHRDLRNAYQGFTYSHASIMRNACDEGLVSRIVQVGVRDFCAEEQDYADSTDGLILTFGARALSRRKARGMPWAGTVAEIIDSLPEELVVSFDIDALEPWLCPNTGTPVPGGLGYEEVFYLLEELVASGRRIVAFDLTEVSPGSAFEHRNQPDTSFDAVVGANIAYRLACLAAAV